ncbi:MAG: PepSY domain-containing protein [Rubrivivax sp.]|nr:PepSY domain-containing protein [Rubrivivax sp.]
MSLGPRFFRWHRWLAWVVAIQVLAWVAGGFVFTWLPFKAWVKGEEHVRRPQQPLPADWARQVARHLEAHPGASVLAVTSVLTPAGPALKLRHAKGETWVGADGQALAPPDEAAMRAFARRHYLGDAGTALAVQRLPSVPPRALIVREAGERTDLWRASFDDFVGTRLYFDARSGELVAMRNDAWVLYDFFWRLHLMDYTAGDDFSHPLVKAASLAALALVLTGAVLAVLAVRRVLRARGGVLRR